MTAKELVEQFCEFRGKCTTDDIVALNFAYSVLVPHWISVEEQDIPLGQWVIAYAPNEINYCKIDVILLMMDETAEDFGITHWMSLPSIEHLKKGDKHDL